MNEQQLAAVKLALEALKWHESVWAAYRYRSTEASLEAITALQSIISQDALDKKADNARELGLSYDDVPKLGCVNHDCDQCKAVLEPVAWVMGNDIYWHENPDTNDYIRQNGEPLYTTPPAAHKPWVGLTNEEREQHRDDWLSNIHDKEFRAIEAKLREKNGGAA